MFIVGIFFNGKKGKALKRNRNCSVVESTTEVVQMVESLSNEFDLSSLVAYSVLKEGIDCVCGEHFPASSDMLRIFSGHVKFECSAFENRRRDFMNLEQTRDL